MPFAFTEHGALMAANLLNSPQTVQMSVFVVRAFVRMRSLLADTRELSRKLLVSPPQWHPRHEPLRFAAGPRLAA